MTITTLRTIIIVIIGLWMVKEMIGWITLQIGITMVPAVGRKIN